MLEIFNNLDPFFEDVFREISVREYSRIKMISAPTASLLLKRLAKEDIIISRPERNLLLFRANRESALFKDLAMAYWRYRLGKVFDNIYKKLLFPQIILFGSIAKIENNSNSDIDIFIDKGLTKVDRDDLEKQLERKVQLHFRDSLRNKNLAKNINNGIRIK